MKNVKTMLICSALCLVSAFPVMGSDDGGDAAAITDAEALAQDAKAYAAAYGVGYAEAARRMLLMHDNGGQPAEAEIANADQLGGAFFDHGANFGYVVRVTGKNPKGPAKLERKAGKAEAKVTRKALRDLERAGDKAAKRAERLAQKGLTEADIALAETAIDAGQSAAITYRTDAMRVAKDARRQLKSNRKQIGEILGLTKFGYGYNVRTGEYRIMVTADGAEARRISGLEQQLDTLLGGPVELEVSNIPTTADHTRGGTALNSSSTSTSHSCTGGFVGYEGTDRSKLGLLTAAHCGNSYFFKNAYDSSNYAIAVPSASRERFDSGMDMQWMTANHIAEGKFYADNSSTARTITGYRSRENTADTGIFGTADGSFVCHYGKTTGQSCGEVYDRYSAPDYSANGCSNGPTYVACDDEFVEVRNKVVSGETQLACFGGDSGGPWFAYGVAFGIHSGGSKTGSAPGQCQKAYYTPIEKAANINVTIFIP